MAPTLRTCRLGRVEYTSTARLQRAARAAREAGAIDDTLLLLEHDAVITCGTRTEAHEIAYARTTDVPVVPVERGGKATYHGPGQVVAYPIVSLESATGGDVKELVRRLEQAIIDTYTSHGLETGRRDGYPGVWVDPDAADARKIASVGLRLTRGVTFHGIALNVTNDLEPFRWFTPCGMPEVEMTSLARERGIEPDDGASRHLVSAVERGLADRIALEFGMHVRAVDPSELHLRVQPFAQADPEMSLPDSSAGSTDAVRAPVPA